MDGSKCPENGNSTDCLLRNLLQFLSDYRTADDAKVDWEPRSFYLTLIIGIAATYIAAIPVVQILDVLTSQKGRKNTESKIGKWSRLNQVRWNWETVAFEATANTPVLGTAFLQNWIEQRRLGSHDDAALSRKQNLFRLWKFAALYGYNSAILTQRGLKPAAKWCEFLEEIGLDGIDPGRMKETNTLMPVLVYQLPDDITAAPAYAQVGFIAAAVASERIQSWSVDSQSGESTLTGVGFRFNLRQHLTLGLVGVYQRSEQKIPEIRAPSPEELLGDIFYGGGVLILENERTRTSDRRIPSFMEVIHLLDGMNRNQISDSLSGSSQIFSRYSDYFWPKGNALPRDCMLIFSLFFCTVPRKVPGFFPVSALKTKHPLTILALNGAYWANARLSNLSRSTFSPETSVCETPQWVNFAWDSDNKTLMEIKTASLEGLHDRRRPTSTEPPGGKIQAIVTTLIPALNGLLTASAKRPGASRTVRQIREGNGDSMKDQKVYRGSMTVLRICLKLLDNPDEIEDWFSKASPWTREYLRLLSLEQLSRVDEWIEEASHGGQNESRDRVATLAANSIILYKAMEVLDFDEGNAKDSKATAKNGDTEQLEFDGVHAVRDCSRDRHCDLLSALRELLNTFNRNTKATEVLAQTGQPNEEGLRDGQKSADFTGATDDPFDLHSFARKSTKHRRLLSNLAGGPPVMGGQASHTNELLRRLGTIIVNNLKPGDDWLLQNQFSEKRQNEGMRDLDDMIIYRYLILTLLFRTAQDTTDLLRSGLWDQVIPIL